MNDKKKPIAKRATATARRQSPWALPMIGIVVLGFVIVIVLINRSNDQGSEPPPKNQSQATTQDTQPSTAVSPIAVPPANAPAGTGTTMEVNKAVMVTAELDFGPGGASIPKALSEIERRYQPADGVGRTFAILDAYGEPIANGKLHLSMHVSSEKAGRGAIVFKRTGQVLWDSAITPVPGTSTAKSLSVYIADEAGATWIVDGSGGAKFILDAKLRDQNTTVREFWPDGAEREVTLVYSACGCPVKVLARRMGEHTVRTKDQPVIFPDDPAAVETIAALMRW